MRNRDRMRRSRRRSRAAIARATTAEAELTAWYAAMVRRFAALEFLERSSDVAAEPVVAAVPLPLRVTATTT